MPAIPRPPSPGHGPEVGRTRAARGTALTIVAVVAALYFARVVLIPIALAVLFTFLLAPLVRRLEHLRLPRVAAVLLVVVAGCGLFGVLAWTVESQAVDLAARLPEYKSNIARKLEVLRFHDNGALGAAQRTIGELSEAVEPAEAVSPTAGSPDQPAAPLRVQVVPPSPGIRGQIMGLIGPLLAPLATAGLVTVFTIFMLVRREDLRNRVIRLLGEERIHATTAAMDDAAERISRYLLMQSAINGGAAVAIGVGLFFLDVPTPWLWGLLAGVLRFIPYVGYWLAALFPLTLSLAVAPDWSQPAMVLGLVITVELVAGNVAEPLLLGTGTGLAPLAILVAAVFWTWLWGWVGLLLATPLTVCIAVLGRHVPRLAFLDVMLGDDPQLSPEAAFYQRLLAGDQEEATRIFEVFAQSRSSEEVFDRLVLPALRMAKRDRQLGDLDSSRDRGIREMLEAVIEDEAGRSLGGVRPPHGAVRVLCFPARDSADELAARMLAEILAAEGLAAEAVSADVLIGEMIERTAEEAPALVCISAVPPGAAVYARVAAKRFRARLPRLKIVVGIWDTRTETDAAVQRWGDIPSDQIVTTIAQARSVILSLTAPDRAALLPRALEVAPANDPSG